MRRLLLATFALLGALALAACTGGAESAGGRGFYAEIIADVEPDKGDRIAALGLPSEAGGVVRWWYSGGPDEIGRWRWEFEQTAPTIDRGTVTTVFDGESQWQYDDRLNAYQRSEPDPLPPGVVLSPSSGMPVGPSNFPDIDTLIEQWQLGKPDGEVTRGGHETVLGRQTEVIEIRPAWSVTHSSGSSVGGSTQSSEITTSGGVVRVFIDPERMFVMRWASDGGDTHPSSTVEISHLDYDIPIDGARLTFDPPSGARETPAANQATNCSTGLSGGGGLNGPAGLLSPAYVPIGFGSGMMTSETARGGCDQVAAQSLVENVSGEFILLRQRLRPGGIPAALQSDDTVRINGRDAYLSDDDGITRLVWSDGHVAAELLSDALTSEELIRIAESAESAQIRPGDDRR